MGFSRKLVFSLGICVLAYAGTVNAAGGSAMDAETAKDRGCAGITDAKTCLEKGREYLKNYDAESLYFGSDCVLKAAAADDPEACFELAKMYSAGRGVPPSKPHAYKWAKYALYLGYRPKSDIENFLKDITKELTPFEAEEITRLMRQAVSDEYTKLEKKVQDEQAKDMDKKMALLKKQDPESAAKIEAFFRAQEEEFVKRQKDVDAAIAKELEAAEKGAAKADEPIADGKTKAKTASTPKKK